MEETFLKKLKRKCYENPFVPIALLFTIGAMGSMLKNLLRNDKLGFQISQRLRLGAQTFGLSALAMQIYVNSNQKKVQINDSEIAKSYSEL